MASRCRARARIYHGGMSDYRFDEKRDNLLEWLFGVRERVESRQNPLDVAALQVDLEDRACPFCRRVWRPWERRCPECGAETTPASQLPPDPYLPAAPPHLLGSADATEEATQGPA